MIGVQMSQLTTAHAIRLRAGPTAREVALSTLFGAYREASRRTYPEAVRLTEKLITCATCARRVRAADADELGWTANPAPLGEGSWSCPLCARLCPDAGAADVGALP